MLVMILLKCIDNFIAWFIETSFIPVWRIQCSFDKISIYILIFAKCTFRMIGGAERLG